MIDGVDLYDRARNVTEIRKEVGMVFQPITLFPHIAVLGNVTSGVIYAKKVKKEVA